MLVVIVLAYLWWFRQAIAQWWRQLMAWLARRPPTAATAVPEPEMWVSEPPRPFASFAHPLTAKLPLRQAIIETFGAAEAWYREAGLPRLPQETPHDFARRLAGSDRRAAKVLPKLADAYGRMIYANSDAQPTDLQTVESVWLLFSQRRENNES